MELLTPFNPVAADVEVQGPIFTYQVPAAFISVPGSIVSSGTFTSPVIPAAGMGHLAVGATSTQAGSLVVNRYLDNLGSISIGAALTASLTANTPALIDNNDGKVFQSITVGIVNSGSVAATPSNVIVVMQP